jgi:hypothetical protein
MMAKYICTQDRVWHNKHLYRLGEIAEFEDGGWPKSIKKDKQGRIIEEKMIWFKPVEETPVIVPEAPAPVVVNGKPLSL